MSPGVVGHDVNGLLVSVDTQKMSNNEGTEESQSAGHASPKLRLASPHKASISPGAPPCDG